MEVTDNRIGYNGGIYRAAVKGDNCLFYKPNEDSIVVGIDAKEASQISVYTSSMRRKEINVKEGLTYLCLKNPEPEKDNNLSTFPDMKLRKIAIGKMGARINKLFFDNLTVDSNNLQIGGYGSWVDDIALPKPGDGYLSMVQFKGRFDLDLTGFNLDEIDDILNIEAEEKEVEEDDFEIKVPEEPKAKLGDIYQLGNHFLMCGDSTKEEDVAKLMNGVKADMVFTDPPYGMNAVSKSGVLSEKYKTDIMNDDDNTVAINSFNLCKNYFKDAKQVWWGANYYTECLPSAECWIVWDKNNGGSDQTDCELAWTNFRSVVRQFTMASEKINRVHPTQKPLNLISQIFKKFDKNNEYNNIVDLFGGSGSTLIACEQLNRKCYMMELDPHYISVIIERYINFTGNDVYRLNPDGTKTNWRDIKCEKEENNG